MNQTNADPHILIVDGEYPSLETLSRLLGRRGYSVSTASTAGEAKSAIERRPPDVVLLDIMMPEVSGMAFLRELRELPSTESLPVILLSSLADTTDIVRGLQAGASDYVTKPIDVPVLIARLETQLKGAARLRSSERQAALLAELAEIDAALVRNLAETASLGSDVREDYGRKQPTSDHSHGFDRQPTAEYDVVDLADLHTTETYFAFDENADTGEFQAVEQSLFEVLENEVARSLRNERPLSVLVLEPDQARALHDEYGLELGIELVGKFVQRVAGTLEQTAALYRYQGTVFCAVLGGLDVESAINAANEIFNVVSGRFFQTELGEFRMTVSIGVATMYPKLQSSPVELVERAFSALDHARTSDRSPIWVARSEGILTPR